MKDLAQYLAELEAEKAAVENENIEEIVEKQMAEIREKVAQQVQDHHQGRLIMIGVKIDTVKHIMED